MASPPLATRDLAADLGAEVLGLDLAQSLDDPATVAALRSLLHDRGVLVLKGPVLTPAQSLDFYRHFLARPGQQQRGQGDALANNDPNLLTGFPDFPEVQLIGNGSSIVEIGPVVQKEPGFWHGDLGTYRETWDASSCNPTMLHALAVPERGRGDGALRWGASEAAALPYTAGATLFVRGGEPTAPTHNWIARVDPLTDCLCFQPRCLRPYRLRWPIARVGCASATAPTSWALRSATSVFNVYNADSSIQNTDSSPEK